MTPVQVLNELAIQLGIESPNWSAYAIEMIAKLLEFGTLQTKKITVAQIEQLHTIKVSDRN